MASQILEVYPVSSHIHFSNFPLSLSCLSVAHPSGHGLDVSSLIPHEWIGDYLGGNASSAIALTSLNCEPFLSLDWKFCTVRDCSVFYSKVVSPVQCLLEDMASVMTN